MPTLWAHEHYWDISSTAVAPPVVASLFRGGYPAFQVGGVSLGMGLGGAVVFYERVSDWLRWAWLLVRRSYRFDAEQRAVIVKTLDAIDHPAFPIAQKAVRKTATTLGFNRPEAWKELSRELKGSAGHAENAFRHLEACRLVRANLIDSTVTNPEMHLIVELSYQGFAWKQR